MMSVNPLFLTLLMAPLLMQTIFQNFNSITVEYRLDQLSDVCNTLNLAVLVITESKLDETIPSNLITIPGYHEPVVRDRNEKC